MAKAIPPIAPNSASVSFKRPLAFVRADGPLGLDRGEKALPDG
jgi:hypothetical protein